MLRFTSYDIVFGEVPNETTLAVSIANCPNRCAGCHSPHLMKNEGELLNEECLDQLLVRYGRAITCVCFMGGDAAPHEVNRLAAHVKNATDNWMKTGWYSGKSELPDECSLQNFDFIKLGPYVECRGGLESPDTNQRFYCVVNGTMIDETRRFWRKRAL